MPSFRRARPPEQPSSPRASTSTSQSSPRTQPPSIPQSILGSTSHHDPPADKDTRLARMKKLAGDTLEIVQTTSSMAAEATADVAVPGLSIALSALSEILRRIMVSRNRLITAYLAESSFADDEDDGGRRGDASNAREDPRDETREILFSPPHAEATR